MNFVFRELKVGKLLNFKEEFFKIAANLLNLVGETFLYYLNFRGLRFKYLFTMNKIKHFIEWQVFGVCTAIGDRVGIASTTIRKYFIYISCLTMGSPVIIYLFVAFWMNVKKYILNARRNPLRYF